MRVRFLLATVTSLGSVAAAITLVNGCGGGGSEEFPPLVDDNDGSVTTFDSSVTITTKDASPTQLNEAGAPICASPDAGCACDEAGATLSCGQVHHTDGDYLSCSPGFITCGADGVWSACIGDQIGVGGDD